MEHKVARKEGVITPEAKSGHAPVPSLNEDGPGNKQLLVTQEKSPRGNQTGTRLGSGDTMR